MARNRTPKTKDPALLAKRSAAAKKGAATKKAKATTNASGNSATAVVEAPKVPSTPIKKLMRNRFALLLDKSGSMNNIWDEAVATFNNNCDSISSAKDQDSEVSLYYFGDSSIIEVLKRADVSKLKKLDSRKHWPSGGTPLYDATAHAIEQLEDNDPDTSKIVMVLTDGEDTTSRMKAASLKKLIKEKQKTDQWTFAFLVPKDAAGKFQRILDIPAGNIQPWDDIKIAGQAAFGGLNRYFEARRTGAKSVQNFFATDLSKLKETDVKKNLANVAKDVKIWSVDKEIAVKALVQSKNGNTFSKGHAFYQLTKPEEVQDYKKILIMEKGKSEVFGPDARDLIGLPSYGTTKVVPGNHANFDIFVQSYSVNRKLVRGTKLIYFHDHVTV